MSFWSRKNLRNVACNKQGFPTSTVQLLKDETRSQEDFEEKTQVLAIFMSSRLLQEPGCGSNPEP